MSEYEDSLRAKARKWAALSADEDAKKESVTAAEREYEKARSMTEAVEKELADCVGGNIRRRVFKVDAGVVIVDWREGASNRNQVSLEDLL